MSNYIDKLTALAESAGWEDSDDLCIPNVWDELVAVVRVAERLSTWTEPGIEYLEADLQVALAALKAKVESL